MAEKTKTMPPMPPIHPGETLREDFLRPLGLTANRLAIELQVPVTRVNDIVRGKRAISADTALRLARHFGTTPQFWMNLQANYDAGPGPGCERIRNRGSHQAVPGGVTGLLWLAGPRVANVAQNP